MPSRSFGDRISDVQVMLTGMKNNAKEAGERGWTAEKSTQLSKIRDEAIALNDEQEKLKAELKVKSAELSKKMAAVSEGMREAKKVVKLGFQQEKWKEFGVSDKR